MSQRNIRKTTEEFKQEVYNLVKTEYEVLGEYKTKDEKILMKHIPCGTEFDVRPHNFLRGTRCPVCGMKNRKYNNMTLLSDILNRLDGKGFFKYFDIVSKLNPAERVTGRDYKISIKSKTTSEEYTVTIKQLLRFKDFKNPSLPLNRDSFEKRIRMRNPDISIISEYTGNKNSVTAQCSKCGAVFSKIANNLMNNPSCPNCRYQKGLMERRSNLINSIRKYRVDVDEYNFDTEMYFNNKSKIKITHKKCGTEFFMSIHDFCSGKNSCPSCSKSYYEKVISKYLSDYNISFEEQVKFEGCKLKALLPFDFYLREKNILIEYDGIQHYIPVYGIKTFKKRVKADKIKNEYCKKMKINLIRIPYFKSSLIPDIITMISNDTSVEKIYDYLESQGSTTIPIGGEIPQ